MYMDLTDMISGGMEEQQIPEQKLTKVLNRKLYPSDDCKLYYPI